MKKNKKREIDLSVMKEPYKLTLTMTGIDYKADGETIDEALSKLNLDWQQIKAKGVVKITRDKNTLEHLFYLGQLKRIFVNKLTRQMWAKRLQLFLKEKETASSIGNSI